MSSEQLDSLPTEELIIRMDEFINDSFNERNSHLPPNLFRLPNKLVSQLICTQSVQSKSDEIKRKIAYLCFSYLIQSDLGLVNLGMTNLVLYSNFNESKWRSPLFRLNHAALTQYQIVASRMAFEVFIDLLLVLETGERIDAKKSKLKTFKKWLCQSKNPFNYFAHVLLIAYHFDREQRTPEVHGTSKFPRKLLCLQTPSSEQQNNPLHLTNALTSAWDPLLDILNSRKPTQMQIPLDNDGWFTAFMSQDESKIEQELEKLFQDI